jgi:hypothetical protein
MARRVPTPRKQRTRQHVIASQSANFIERFIIDAGHTAQRVEKDYGYDLLVSTFDEQGYLEPGLIYIQLKASDAPESTSSGVEYVFDLAIEDYNLWIEEPMPVLLVLFDAQKRRAFWLYMQRYFGPDPSRKPRKGAKTVRVFIPLQQRFGRRTVVLMRSWKRKILEQLQGRISHD